MSHHAKKEVAKKMKKVFSYAKQKYIDAPRKSRAKSEPFFPKSTETEDSMRKYHA